MNLRDNMDRKGEKSVHWKGFVVAFMDKNIAKREENIQKVLRRFSKGTKTHLGIEDVSKLFGGEDAAREIFDYLDTNGDGKISLKDFQKVLEESIDEPDDDEGDFESDDEFHDG